MSMNYYANYADIIDTKAIQVIAKEKKLLFFDMINTTLHEVSEYSDFLYDFAEVIEGDHIDLPFGDVELNLITKVAYLLKDSIVLESKLTAELLVQHYIDLKEAVYMSTGLKVNLHLLDVDDEDCCMPVWIADNIHVLNPEVDEKFLRNSYERKFYTTLG